MGDVLHLMPALNDLQQHHPDIKVDWMVEESFAEIPQWHSMVDKVIVAKTRQWRKFNWQNTKSVYKFIKGLRNTKYDVVIDAQGLIKSAVLSRFARLNKGGKRVGFSGDSIKESPAAYFYKQKVVVERDQHAIERLRDLFAMSFSYERPTTEPRFELLFNSSGRTEYESNMVLFFHGTTWDSKHLPDHYWKTLVQLAVDDGYKVGLCWGTEKEKSRAEWIAQGNANTVVLPKMTLTQLAQQINSVAGVIAVDTGLGHLSAALGVPAVSIYGSTDAKLTGSVGENQIHLQTQYPCSPCLLKVCNKLTEQVLEPPCYQSLPPSEAWQALYESIA